VIEAMRKLVAEPRCRRAPSIAASDVVEPPGGELGVLPEIWESVSVEAAGPFPDLARARAGAKAESWKIVDLVPDPQADALRARSGCGTRAVTPAATPAPVAVPDLRGLTAEQAVARLQGAGLAADPIAGGAARSRAEQYTIESQEPAAGATVAPGSRVRIAVRPAYVEPTRAVPSVVGLAAAAADARLKTAGFVAQVTGGDPAPSAERSFTVQDQQPAGGASAPPGSTVTVRVYSKPSTRRTVPSLVGLAAADADRRLKELGLVAEIAGGDPAPSAERAFTVQWQQPAPGTVAEAGVRVQVRVHSAFAAPRPVATSSPAPPPPVIPPGGGDPSVFFCPALGGRAAHEIRLAPGADGVTCHVGYRHAGRSVSFVQAWWKVPGKPKGWGGACGSATRIDFIAPSKLPFHTIDLKTGQRDERVSTLDVPGGMGVQLFGTRRQAKAFIKWDSGREVPVPSELLDFTQRLLAEAEWRGESCDGTGPPPPTAPPGIPSPTAAPPNRGTSAPIGGPPPDCDGLLGQGECR
jgi:beta-lactam-binding protein with PASTA domain